MYVCMYISMYVFMYLCMYGMVWYDMVWYGMVWYSMYLCVYDNWITPSILDRAEVVIDVSPDFPVLDFDFQLIPNFFPFS